MHRPARSSSRLACAASLVLLSLLLWCSAVSAQLAFEALDVCPTTTAARLDSTSLDCVACATGQVASADGYSCDCAAGYQRSTSASDLYTVTCTACTNPTWAVLQDASTCVPCDSTNGATYSSARADCVCASGYVLVEYDAGGALFSAGKRCVACDSAYQVFQDPTSSLYDPYTCAKCPDSRMTMDSTGVCTCTSLYTKANYGDSEVCVLTTSLSTTTAIYSPTTAEVMQYNDVRATDSGNTYALTTSVNSYIILRYFAWSVTNCLVLEDRSACQSLANMCVLQKYAQSSTACLAFAAISSAILTYEHDFTGDKGWKTSLPFIYRDTTILTASAQLISQSVTLSNTVTTDNSETGTLHFRLYKYSINGTYLGWDLLTTQLQLCGGDPSLLSNFLRFGTNYENSCSLDLTPYVTQTETIFYDPYLVDTNSYIYPMPIKVLNLRDSNGDTPNRKSIYEESVATTNVLSRRFYIVDAVSGVEVSGGTPRVLSYLKSAVLRVQMKGGSNSQIRVPLLVLNYGEREVTTIVAGGGGQYSTVSFEMQYRKTSDGLWQAAYALFGVSLGLALILVARRMWVWQRANGTEVLEINLFMFVRFIIYFFSAMGDLFFIMLCCLSFYCWLFYKGQKAVWYLLPSTDGSEVSLLKTFVVVCFVAKLLDIIFQLYSQVKIEVFFMDWEKPKGLPNDIASEEEGTLPTTPGSVSVWRKLFAANKWNDLQSARLINVPFTLFLMIFLMEPSGLGLKYLATAQPSPSNLDSTAAPLHPILSFAVTTFFLLIICYLQLLYAKQVTHRYFKDEVAQFVDLLCTSNISCLVLDERQHGYYLHGKTVHPHADVSLEEMNAGILSEERKLTRERGLLPGKDSFEIYVTHAWRQNYDELYSRLFTKQSIHNARAARSAARGQDSGVEMGARGSGGRGSGGRGGMGHNGALSGHNEFEHADTSALISSALLKANASLNVWLTSFVNREPQFPYPYDLAEHESVRQLLGLPVALSPSAPCTMYDDPDFAFTKVLLCGIESDLILFLVLLYAFCDLLFDSILVATLVCFIVDWLMVSFRSHWGQINISRKTLLDERFLI